MTYHIIVDLDIDVPLFDRFPHVAVVVPVKAFGGTVLCLILGLYRQQIFQVLQVLFIVCLDDEKILVDDTPVLNQISLLRSARSQSTATVGSRS